MIHLIEPKQAHSLRPLFDVPHLGFVVDAMAAGNSPATIWVDDIAQPRSAFIWDTTHSLYVGGTVDNPTFIADLGKLISETLLPEGQKQQLGVFKLYSASAEWAAQIPQLLQRETLPMRDRVLLRFDPENMIQSSEPVPGFQVQPITRELLENAGRANAENVLEEIGSCWTALDRFYAQGFGFCVIADNGDIAGWCTAEYVSDRVCGVGIETVEAYQGQGVATMAAQAFVQHCAERGWIAHWDSWTANLPSVKVAQKAGFQKVIDYDIQIYMFDE